MANYYAETLKEKSRDDVVFFISNCCKTFDPRTGQKDLDFKLYPFQEDYARELVEHIKSGKDMFTEKSRDMGVSWVTLAVILWFWLFEEGFQCLMGSRKEDYVDNRSMDSLFGKLDYLIRNLPWRIRGYDPKKQRLFMKLTNPETKAEILGESANENFSRAGRYKLVFFDELAFWPFQEGSWTAAGDASPCRIAVTTPSMVPSFAKALRNSGLIDVKTLHWKLHPLKDDVWYDKQKERRLPEEIARELDINWEGSIQGRVYPEIKEASLDTYPFLPDQQLYVSWDFGLDGVAIQWWQKNPKNSKWRLVASYTNQDKVIDFYFPFFGVPIDSNHQYRLEDLDLIAELKDLPKAIHFGDPDVEKRSLLTGTSTREALAGAGIHVNTNKKSNDFESRKTEAKRILIRGIEVNNTPQNKYFMECVRNARYPLKADSAQPTGPSLKPVHDWTSHHRTSFEYFAVNQAAFVADEPEFATFGRESVSTRREKSEEFRTFRGYKS